MSVISYDLLIMAGTLSGILLFLYVMNKKYNEIKERHKKKVS